MEFTAPGFLMAQELKALNMPETTETSTPGGRKTLGQVITAFENIKDMTSPHARFVYVVKVDGTKVEIGSPGKLTLAGRPDLEKKPTWK